MQCLIAELQIEWFGSRPDQGHSIVFLGETPYFHTVFLHQGVQMGTGKFNAGRLLCYELASHPAGE